MATKQQERDIAERAFGNLIRQADEAGHKAVRAKVPTPMIVEEHASPFNDASPVVRAYYVESGPCGFAWIAIYPATTPFARWLKKHGVANPAYRGGLEVWVSEFGQSIELKKAYAEAYAKVLQAAGYKAYAGSRLD